MKQHAMLVVLAAACSGGDETVDGRRFISFDADYDADLCSSFWSSSCNITADTGCDPGERCTWMRATTDPAAPPSCRGQIGCAPIGDVPIDGACRWGASGPTTGYDDCVRGAICVAANPTVEAATGTCKAVCSLADGTAPCAAGFTCVRSPLLFHNNPATEMPIAGVCDSTCDPLTQVQDSDGARACGSRFRPAERGCYGFPSDTGAPTAFSCMHAGTGAHRTIAIPPISTNSCAVGAIPMLRESSGSMQVVCIAYCAPLTTNTTTPIASKAGASPHSCPEVGAPGPGERCQHLWFWEGPNTPITAASNAVGFCVDFTKYTWNHDAMPSTPAVPWTPCEDTVPYTDPSNPSPTEDLFWGCAPHPIPGAPLSGRARWTLRGSDTPDTWRTESVRLSPARAMK